jgi:hypothetical protein
MKRTMTAFTFTLLLGVFGFSQANNPPVLDTLYLIDRATQSGGTISFVAFANDIDNDPLAFDLDAASLNKGMTIDPTSGSFQWMTDINGTNDGVHTVTVFVTDGIDTDQGSFTITVGTTTGINDLKQEVKIFPNPAQEVLTILSDVNAKEVKIISAQGKLVQTGLNTQSMDVSTLSSGVYFVECLLQNNQVVTRQFVKN